MKLVFFRSAGAATPELDAFARAIASVAEVTTIPFSGGEPPKQQIEAAVRLGVALIDANLKADALLLAKALPAEMHVFFVGGGPVPLLGHPESEIVAGFSARGAWIDASAFSEEEWKRHAALAIAPHRARGVVESAGAGRFATVHKLQDLSDIGWVLDTVYAYLSAQHGNPPPRFTEFRQAVTGAAGEAFERAREAGEAHPTIALQVVPDSASYAFSLRFPAGKLDFAKLAENAVRGRSTRWHLAWQACDLLGLVRFEREAEIEVRGVVSAVSRDGDFRARSILAISLKEAPKAEEALTPAASVVFRTFDSLLDEIPADKPKRVAQGSAPAEVASTENESALAKLMHKKSQLVQQLSERVEQEQQASADRQKKVSEMLMEAKTELESSRRDLLQAKSQLKILERQAENNKATASSVSSEEAEKQLAEINNSLRSATNQKATTEEKLALAEKKVEILEGKYAKSIREIQEKEKELNETKPVILKLTKELEAAQTTLKQQSQNVPVQIGNEDSEKKIKALSSKIYDMQQKEIEHQLLVKKMSLKLEQSEIGKKSGKNENEGRLKQLEKQVEQAKTKEKELMKKIEDLMNALKKAKTGKAA